MNKPQLPVPRYKLELTVTGNTLDEIRDEIESMIYGGYLLDSDLGRLHEWNVIGGTTTRRMHHINPDMTPERYSAELREWFDDRRVARKDRP